MRELKNPSKSIELLERREMLDATAELVRDINQTPWGVSDNAWLGDEIFFAADDGTGDVELWKSDGTTEGTVRVLDIRGGGSSIPKNLQLLGNHVLFTAYNDESGRTLWRTDGTGSGTVPLTSATVGQQSVQSNGVLYFAATRPDAGTELWASDGTEAGTKMIANIRSGVGSSNPDFLAVVGDDVYFSAEDGVHGLELWRTDGTVEGTSLVYDAAPGEGSSTPREVMDFGNAVYFVADTKPVDRDQVFTPTDNATSLFKHSDGTTTRITDPDSIRNPQRLMATDEVFFFQTKNSGTSGFELWRTDGTTGGTLRIADEDRDPTPEGSLNGILYYVTEPQRSQTGEHIRQLWRTDGSAEGTYVIKKVAVRGNINLSPYSSFVAIGDSLFFVLQNATDQRSELWQTDGSLDGTRRIGDLENPNGLVASGANLYLTAEDEEYGSEAFRVGDFGNTVEPIDLVPGPSSGNRSILATRDDGAFIWSDSPVGLWYSNGSSSRLISSSISGQTDSAFRWASRPEFVPLRHKVLFPAYFAHNFGVLWRTDGTMLGSDPVESAPPLSGLDFFPTPTVPDLTKLIDHVYFVIEVDNRTQLWRTDGDTSQQVGVDKNLVNPSRLEASGDLLFFEAGQESNRSVWRTDGTEEGTYVVHQDFWNRRVDRFQATSFVWQDRLYYLAMGEHGTELWATEGTTAGTSVVEPFASTVQNVRLMGSDDRLIMTGDGQFLWANDIDITVVNSALPERSSVRFSEAGFVGNHLYFHIDDNQGGNELWRSDGTADGTERVFYSFSEQGGWYLQFAGAIGNDAYFFAPQDGETWLWRTDGTEEGTTKLAEWKGGCGGDGGGPYPAVAGGHLFFQNTSDEHGCEMWMSDGTVSGTTRVTDINPGTGSSNPKYQTEINGYLYFAADDGFHGTELYRLKLDAPDVIPGDANGNGTVDFADFLVLSQNFGRSDDVAFADGDFDADGEIDFSDFLILSAAFGNVADLVE